jgi:DNA-binding LacI/PurR family transcriptional regulator
MGKITLQTIADEVGVSRMTVSNAFSRPDQLSPALRERILSVAERLGYCGPDPAARTLSQGRSGTVGVLFTDTLSYAFSDEVATTFLAGVAGVLEREGIGLTVLSVPRGGPASSVERAVVDGLIVYSVDTASPGLARARLRDIPLVFADQEPEAGIASVNVDDWGGARAAAEHVIGLGHRHIGLVLESLAPRPALVDPATRAPHHVVAQRLGGWLEAIEAARLPAPVAASAPVNGRKEGAAAAALILDADPRTTALLCLTDEMALGALDLFRDRGLRVPEDVSVVGFDDSSAASAADPPLTTVHQPLTEKGRIAARLLLDALAEPGDSGSAPSTLLPTQLVVRASTGPAPMSSPVQTMFSRRRS